jgi:hypothetical protein
MSYYKIFTIAVVAFMFVFSIMFAQPEPYDLLRKKISTSSKHQTGSFYIETILDMDLPRHRDAIETLWKWAKSFTVEDGEEIVLLERFGRLNYSAVVVTHQRIRRELPIGINIEVVQISNASFRNIRHFALRIDALNVVGGVLKNEDSIAVIFSLISSGTDKIIQFSIIDPYDELDLETVSRKLDFWKRWPQITASDEREDLVRPIIAYYEFSKIYAELPKTERMSKGMKKQPPTSQP